MVVRCELGPQHVWWFLQRKSSTQAMAALTDAEQAKESPSLKKSLEMSVAPHDALPSIKAHKRVVLVRHGESTWNAIGRIQGSSDFAVLTPKGESQAETSRQMLLGDSFDSCFYRFSSSSDLGLFCTEFLQIFLSEVIAGS